MNMIMSLANWWLWKRRNTVFDSRRAFVKRAREAIRKLDNGKKVNVEESDDALSWDIYCTGGTINNIKWTRERWDKYQRAGQLPNEEWTIQIQPYPIRMYDDPRSLLITTAK